jgi:hypothetical protein
LKPDHANRDPISKKNTHYKQRASGVAQGMAQYQKIKNKLKKKD